MFIEADFDTQVEEETQPFTVVRVSLSVSQSEYSCKVVSMYSKHESVYRIIEADFETQVEEGEVDEETQPFTVV